MGARILLPLLSVAGLSVAAACGSGGGDGGADPVFRVTSVEYAFVTRAFGSPLPVAVVDLSVRNDSPSGEVYVTRGQLSARAVDGAALRPVAADGASICYDPLYSEPELSALRLSSAEEGRGRLVFPLPSFDTRLETLLWDNGDGVTVEIDVRGQVVTCAP